MNDCVFCRVLEGTEPGTLVFRGEQVAALMDIQPVNPGHVLVVPVHHAADLAELGESGARQLMGLAHRVALALRRSGLRCEGVNLFVADGEAAGQDVFHTHVHVIPRFHGDGFGLRFGPDYSKRPARAELEEAASLIRRQFDAAGAV